MARIAGLELNDKWKVDYALTRVKGLGWVAAEKVLAATKIDNTRRVASLTAEEVSKITAELDNYTVEGDLVRQIRENIQRLKDITAYRGVRHSRGLPVRGQRTKSNARTKRGARKTIGAFKKDMMAKADTSKKTDTKK